MTAAAETAKAPVAKVTDATEVDAAAPVKPASKKRVVVLGILGLGILSGTSYWVLHRGLESTDDAQVDAEVVALAPRISGVVVKVGFAENQQVKAGQVLAELDDAPAKAKLAQAEANLEAAMATADAADADARLTDTSAKANRSMTSASLQAASAGAMGSRDQIAEAEARVQSAQSALTQATNDRDRTAKLVQSGALGQAQLDQVKTDFDTATATLAQARAHLGSLRANASEAASHVQEASARADQAKQVDVVIAQAQARAKAAHAQVDQLKAARDLAALDVTYTKIIAPSDGVVSKKSISVGQTVAVGTPVVQLVPAQAMWITANFKETQVGNMRVGQRAEISIDAFPSLTLHGEVESFSAATGARFALLPPDNASGNFTKVVQRVPIRVKLVDVPPSLTLRPGMNVDLTVDTRK
jgi:membrane fusion protein (multidrug efflux system)